MLKRFTVLDEIAPLTHALLTELERVGLVVVNSKDLYNLEIEALKRGATAEIAIDWLFEILKPAVTREKLIADLEKAIGEVPK